MQVGTLGCRHWIGFFRHASPRKDVRSSADACATPPPPLGGYPRSIGIAWLGFGWAENLNLHVLRSKIAQFCFWNFAILSQKKFLPVCRGGGGARGEG